ncbi:KAP family NTPase [Pseudomonas extremaustralis]|uniref:KAP family P-loop NTPase fold protein n=1 Tax=Pseudomonas extremaustralis TaxID=359110 RepID=UPI0021C8CEFC|nr:KAP family NTPase [Pseudomonas extremaustralis]UUJ43214.1 KAP family NTPase [Pseudomonas extremaustralis]
MKLVLQPMPIEDNDFGHDIFGRKSFGLALANIVKNSQDPLVIGLDGNWGEGKSTFVKTWQKTLDQEEVPNIYIDAFASDYVDDAFMVVAGAITDYVTENAPPKKSKEFIEKAKNVGAHVLSLSAKIGIRAISAGVIKEADLDDLKTIGDDISKEISDSAEKYIKDRLTNHKAERESVEHFKSFLSTIPSGLKTPSTYPLTVIIDELDRCRPSFAVEMLEKIKHLFSVPNVNFLLVMNKAQLQESIKSTYGVNIDAHTYLQKFISIEATLPKKKGRDGDIEKYCKYLAHQYGFTKGEWAAYFTALGTQLNCSLRELERIYSNLAIMLLTEKEGAELHEALISAVCTLKVMRPGLFSRLVEDDVPLEDIYKGLKYYPDPKRDNYVMEHILLWLHACLMSDEKFNALDNDDEIKRSGRYIRNRKKFLVQLVQKLDSFSAG